MLAATGLSIAATIILLGLAGVLLLYFFGFYLPRRLAGNLTDEKAVARGKLENDIRGTLLQGIVGALFLVTAYLSFAQLQEDIEHNERDLQVTSDKQLADRFGQAITQLGTQNNLDVRLGGIYALQRIGANSEVYRGPLVDVYAAFVRGHSPWPPKIDQSDGGAAASEQEVDVNSPVALPLRSRLPDVQAVLRILGRTQPEQREGSRLDLEGTDLRRADLRRAHLEMGLFHRANLSQADLNEAHLERASLVGAVLTDATLTGAFLQGVNLSASNLEGSDLSRAQFDTKTKWTRTKTDCETKWPNDEVKEAARRAGALMPVNCVE